MSKSSDIQRLPLEVDPFRLVEQQRQLDGRLPLGDYPRLSDLLLDDDNTVHVKLDFTRTETGLPVIRGKLDTSLNMQCNRCLKSAKIKLDHDIEVVLVSSDAQAAQLQQGFDTWLVEDQRLFLQDFIEDELLLALPLVVSHDECKASRELIEAMPEEEKPKDKNPFAELRNLKLNK